MLLWNRGLCHILVVYYTDYMGGHMPVEQWILSISIALLGGGTLGVIIKAMVARRLGLTKSANEATRDTNTAWDSIVENLQQQITLQTKNFTEQVERLSGEVATLKKKHEDLEQRLNLKDRLLLAAIAHIGKLEALIPPKPVPARPEGLE